MSRASLVRATGLSKPTITNVVAFLESLNYIERVDHPAPAQSGRSARTPVYGYQTSRGEVLGIDIGADKTLLILADLAGTILARTRLNTRTIATRKPKRIIEAVARAAKKLRAEDDGSDANLAAVVVGTPGVVSADGVVTMAPQLEGWEGLDLRAALAEHFPCPVEVESEVSLSLQAERWVGVAQGISDALFVNLGIGVGAGLLVDGQIRRGANGGAGEIGLMPYPRIAPDGTVELAPLESETGGGALRRRGQELADTPAGSKILEMAGGTISEVNAFAVFKAMRESDPAATALVHENISRLAWGIAGVVCAVNPQAVVVGGGLSRAADLFLPELQEQVSRYVPFPPQWLVSSLGDEAVALGAVNKATEIVENSLFLTPEPKRSV
jgi:glucokinase